VKVFILEDDPFRHVKFEKELLDYDLTIRTEVDSAVKCLLESDPFNAYFFDHDLGGKQMVESTDYDTGYQVVQQLLAAKPDYFKTQAVCVVHSLNPAGAENIASLLPDGVIVAPFIRINWPRFRQLFPPIPHEHL
jgi:hypothetical protein